MTDHDNGFERLLNAVTSMASSPARLRNRLSNAWLTLMPLRASDFDPDLGQRFVDLRDRVTTVDGPQGRIEATLAGMPEPELEEVAKGITGCSQPWSCDEGSRTPESLAGPRCHRAFTSRR